MKTDRSLTFTMPPARRLVLIVLLMVAGACITGVLASLISGLGGPARQIAMMRIATVLQDILMLVVPAVAAAVLICRQPARLLALDRAPGWTPTILAVGILLLSSPAMSVVINWNASLHLPQSLAGLEATLRAAEDAAGHAVELVLGAHTVGNLVMSLLIVGILAGFSEELFFRGALQRTLHTAPMSAHTAIWITAVFFSLVHFQVFGFVPRMLLGAYFGYLLWWSGSVWLPMIVHVANNSLFIILRYTTGNGEPDIVGSSPGAVIASIALTAAGLWILHRSLALRNQNPS